MNKKNKIIVISILIIITIVSIYLKIQDNSFEKKEEIQIEETNEENSNTITENNDENNKIVVYITGEVNKPGVYEIEENSRITNVIEKAGGLTPNANIDDINLAYKIKDETKIYIPKKDEEIKNTSTNNEEKYISTTSKNVEETNISAKQETNIKVNINTATQSELETLPGIGPSTALKIIQYREEQGKFNMIEDIKKVSGIGENKYQKIKDFIYIK